MDTRVLYNYKSLTDVWAALLRLPGFLGDFLESMKLTVPGGDQNSSLLEAWATKIIHPHRKTDLLKVSGLQLIFWADWNRFMLESQGPYSPWKVLYKDWLKQLCHKEFIPPISSVEEFMKDGVRNTIKIESWEHALEAAEVIELVHKLLGATSRGRLSWRVQLSADALSTLFAPGVDLSDVLKEGVTLCYRLIKKDMVGGTGVTVSILVSSDASYDLVTRIHDAIGIYYPCDPETEKTYPFTLPLRFPSIG